jgi:hypothetical protein
MKRYSCLVALAMNTGNINPHHEIPKSNVSRAEIVLLRALHGKDAVFNILAQPGEYQLTRLDADDKEVKFVASDMDVYQHLYATYPTGNSREEALKIKVMIERLFNVRLDDDLGADLDDLEEGLDAEAPRGQRTAAMPNAADDDPDLEIPPPGSGRQERKAVLA